MDSPGTNLGDGTYLGRHPPDFDMTQEPSFQSPSKDNNLLQQLRNGRGANLRTPRGSRAPLGDRPNLLAGMGGSEFTPMLKSATRNSARRRGKENTNGIATPALGKIDEDMDMTNVPVESSLFGPSRNMSYVSATPLPEADASSTTSTPMVLPTRRGGNNNNKGPLQDGNQLSLREQENVIDKIEKENFGLKLKIHFLEEALRKTGPGFSEAALQENTELKVDKVTMQRELSKYKKHLASAEKDLETYQQQILDVQERAKKKYADQSQKAENDDLRRRLEEKEAEIDNLERKLQQNSQDDDQVGRLREEIGDLEADLRAKDQELNEREDEIDKLKEKSEKTEQEWETAEADIQRLQLQLKRQSHDKDQVNELQGEINDLKADLRAKDLEINHGRSEVVSLQQQQLQKQSKGDGYITQLHNEINSLKSNLHAKDLEINQRRHEIKIKSEELEAERRNVEKMKDSKSTMDELKSELREVEERWKTAEAKIKVLQQQRQSQDDSQINQLRNEITNLEAKLRQKDLEVEDHANEIDILEEKLERTEDNWKAEVEKHEDEIFKLNTKLEAADRRRRTAEEKVIELQENDRSREELAEATDTIKVLESNIRRLQEQLDDRKDELQHALDAEGALSGKEKKLRDTLNSETERHRSEEAVLSRQIDSLKRDLEARQSTLTSLRTTLNSETESHNAEKAALDRQINILKRDLDTRQFSAVTSETERHQGQETALSRQIDSLQRDLDARQSTLLSLRNEISTLRENLRQSERDYQDQADKLDTQADKIEAQAKEIRAQADIIKDQANKIEALEDEVEVISTLRENLRQRERDYQDQADKLDAQAKEIKAQVDKIEALEDDVEVQQTMHDDELEDAIEKLKEADEECQDLRRQLQLSKREQVARGDRLGQLEDADILAERLSQQLRDTKQKLHDAEQECKDLQRKLQSASREQSKEVVQAQQTTEDLQRQLRRAQRESKEAKLSSEEFRSQLDTSRQDLDQVKSFCRELRQKLDRALSQRDKYQASVEKLQYDCDRLKKGAEDALAWIQAKNAQKPNSSAPGPIKKATMATFRYGDVVMDVVDQKDHEAVIRAADSAQRRHEKEVRGMALQLEWMQARWERESKLRHDGAFAKKFLQLRLDIADACNKADLRALGEIHQQLGLKPPSELASQKRKNRKPVNKLKVFVAVVRAVARMRIDARKWGEHEKTRLRLVTAWEKQQKQKQVVC